MKWLEIIEVRAANSNRDLLQSHLKRIVSEVQREAEKQGITIFRQVLIDTDFSVHLSHHTGDVEKQGSQLGLQLASLLKECGLVYHSIWVEMHEYNDK